jgi:hypothetical protein
LTEYYLNDETRKALQSIGETVRNMQLQIANNPGIKLAIQKQQELSQQLSSVASVYQDQMENLNKIVRASGITETMKRVSLQMIESALQESGLATVDEPNEENINIFIQLLETISPLAKAIGMQIILNLILPFIYLALIHMGVDLQHVSDLHLPALTILPVPAKNKED